MAKPPTSVRSIRLPVDVWEALEGVAKLHEKSVNALVAEAVGQTLRPEHPVDDSRLFAELRALVAGPPRTVRFDGGGPDEYVPLTINRIKPDARSVAMKRAADEMPMHLPKAAPGSRLKKR